MSPARVPRQPGCPRSGPSLQGGPRRRFGPPARAPTPGLVGFPPISLLLRLLMASGLPPRPLPLPSSCVRFLCFLLAFNSTGFHDSSQASLCSHVRATFLRFATSLALRFFEKGKAVSYDLLLMTSESQQGCASPSPAVRRGPSPAPLLSCGRDEASRVRVPVCGLCPVSTVRALVARPGFPLFGPYHRTPQRPTVSLTESETAGGWVLPWTCLLFQKKWVVFPASSLCFCKW